MDSNYINRFSPIVTGAPAVKYGETTHTVRDVSGSDFKELLLQKMNGSLSFSKHAVNRVLERNVDISDSSLERLSDGVKLAEEKGLSEPLILIDSTAYIVSIKNSTVITTVPSEDLKGNVFTNIDGTVII